MRTTGARTVQYRSTAQIRIISCQKYPKMKSFAIFVALVAAVCAFPQDAGVVTVLPEKPTAPAVYTSSSHSEPPAKTEPEQPKEQPEEHKEAAPAKTEDSPVLLAEQPAGQELVRPKRAPLLLTKLAIAKGLGLGVGLGVAKYKLGGFGGYGGYRGVGYGHGGYGHGGYYSGGHYGGGFYAGSYWG